jgi:hypothetical protein
LGAIAASGIVYNPVRRGTSLRLIAFMTQSRNSVLPRQLDGPGSSDHKAPMKQEFRKRAVNICCGIIISG